MRKIPAPVARLVTAATGGVGVALGFAPVGHFIPVVLGTAALILALRGSTARTGAVVGAVFGVVFLTLLVWWVHVLGIGVLAALVAASVPFYAAFGAAFAVVSRTRAWPLWGACLWVAIELCRSVVPFGGFAWGRLAFTTVGTPFEAYARWVGVAATSGVVFALAAALVVVVGASASLRARGGGVVAALALLVVAVALPTGTADPGRTTRIALVQGNVPGTGADGGWQQREVLDNHVRATMAYADRVRSGATPRPDLVLWPENASDIDPFHDGAAGRTITATARAVGAPILVGAILDGPTPDTAENVGIAWDPRTGPGQRYVKRHLVPFGEYVPFRGLVTSVLPYVGREIPRDMLPGSTPGAVNIGNTVVGDMMCFDVVFDRLARDAVVGGAELLVVQTNNATYTGTAQPDQQWQIARMRAVESGRTVAVPSTNGVSGVIDADGEVVTRSRPATAQVLTAEVTTARGMTWGTWAGGYVEDALAGAGLLALVLTLRRRRRDHRGVGMTTSSPVEPVREPAPAA